jgi:hypothetical protein
MRYVITEGQDGVFWVSLQPLLADINEQLENPEVSTNQLVVDSLFAVKAFVEAMIDEGKFQKYSEPRDDEISYKDSLQ